MAAQVGDENAIAQAGEMGGVGGKLRAIGGKAMAKDDRRAVARPVVVVAQKRAVSGSKGLVQVGASRGSGIADQDARGKDQRSTQHHL